MRNKNEKELRKNVKNIFNENLERLLKEKNISIKDLERDLELPENTYFRLISQLSIDFPRVLRIADYLNISIWELLPTNINGELKSPAQLQKEMKEELCRKFLK